MHVHEDVCMYMYISMYVHVHLCVCTCTFICMHVHEHVCVCTCTFVCMYMYICVCANAVMLLVWKHDYTCVNYSLLINVNYVLYVVLLLTILGIYN